MKSISKVSKKGISCGLNKHSRRNFLSNALKITAGLFTLPVTGAFAENTTSDGKKKPVMGPGGKYDILVAGGGIAGVAAA
ncbi:MAG: hypothetical protein PHR77_18480, partial [Kiritimatiellae bacterium]|nr:hypothetical protein [Kiritimatiellia bacterium]